MREFGICRTPHDLNIALFELLNFFLEAVKLSRADECEVLRVKEENDIFIAEILVEAEVFDDVFSLNSFGVEGRC